MTFGPYQTEEAGKTITLLVKNEAIPAVKSLQELAIRVADYRVSFVTSLFRKNLNSLDEEFKTQNKKFLKIYHRYSTPDILFADFKESMKDQTVMGKMMGDYFNSQQAVMRIFQEGFHFLEVIDRQLDRRFRSSDQVVTMILSGLAIVVAALVAFLK